MITRVAFQARVLAHGRAKVSLPRQLPPVAIIRSYRAKLVRGPVADAMALVQARLVPALERLAASASRLATTDAREDAVGEILDEIRDAHAEKWTRDRFGSVVRNIGPELEKFHAAQLNRQMRALVTVDVVGSEPWLEGAIAEFTRENVALIRTIPSTFFDGLEKKLAREIADGVRWEEMVLSIEAEHGASANRAELIARDQAGKFMGDLNRVRQSDLGITRAIWRTVNDNRVREEHADREGQSFEWAAGIEGETPGEPVLCRCNGEPDIEAPFGRTVALAKGCRRTNGSNCSWSIGTVESRSPYTSTSGTGCLRTLSDRLLQRGMYHRGAARCLYHTQSAPREQERSSSFRTPL